MTAFAVCSDTQVGKRRKSTDDIAEIEVTDLAFPATTDPNELVSAVSAADCQTMRVVFATYQSISVISKAQKDKGLPDFDLILCDEAHRTTGATLAGEDSSNFVKVHDNAEIRGNKRIYMTATPRIYGEYAKSKAKDVDAILASMDDEKLYGEVMYHHSFAQAVERGILTDYRVIVLAMDEGQVSTSVLRRLSDGDSALVLDDATKILGCWKALAKDGLSKGLIDDPDPMRRALAFCGSIRSSKLIKQEFVKVVDEFREQSNGAVFPLRCEVEHVDGSFKARERGKLLDWLKEDPGGDVCRVLSNARCLIEGVDLPALDAIMFLHPRNSQIDVVQSVGRVMRKAPGKRMGYVILPVGIPPGVKADQALNDNKRYRVVWQILNALRAHDERLDAVINQGRLGQDISDRIAIIDSRSRSEAELREVSAVVQDFRANKRSTPIFEEGAKGSTDYPEGVQQTLDLVVDDFSRAIMAKIVEKCGTREYWEDWATNVAEIAERHVTRLTSLVHEPGSDAEQFFQDFLQEIRDDLNEAVTEQDAIEMLAQHLITRPVFDALFEGHDFVERNPVSVAMSEVLSVIDSRDIGREADQLEGFYASVRQRAKGITDLRAKQNLIVELYDKFFRGAFPRTVEMLGIVYTPVEIVDFIIKSVDEALWSEFGQTLSSEGVHILDPFTGTGTFITRLLQLGLIEPQDLERKYREEIHANELVLLAYYIAAINIETTFHALSKRGDYLPFNKICLTDTFAMHEGDNELSFYMRDNSDRRERQKKQKIRVILGNPPYSAGQRSENENAQNVAYAGLDNRIKNTYVALSSATTVRHLYDSYIRAIRWGSDRLGEAGVIGFITNAGWLDSNAMDGMRKCLAEEFSSIHVFHLRGNARTSGDQRKKESGNVFGEGSRAPTAITVLVKNPDSQAQGQIFFHDIGDYLSRKEKLDLIRGFGSMGGINTADRWKMITPDRHGDWLNQRNDKLDDFIKIGDKQDKIGPTLFGNYSLGVATNRDAWCINSSRERLERYIESTINFYNSEVDRWKDEKMHASHDSTGELNVSNFVDSDSRKISWSYGLKRDLEKGKYLHLNDGQIVLSIYRPFTKQWQFFSSRLNERLYQMPRIFPNAELPNRVISVTGRGSQTGFSAFMVDSLFDNGTIDKGQSFPIWLYEKFFDELTFGSDNELGGYHRIEAITERGLEHFQMAYPGEDITREDIFYYVYGLLHSNDYRSRFHTNLRKELPQIPCVRTFQDFQAFRNAGERLGELHVGYESVKPYPALVDLNQNLVDTNPESAYRVTKMRHPGSGKNKDRSTIIYNHHITVSEIPNKAWEYVVNGKSALAWVMERQCVKTDKASGIVNDANLYATETVGDPRYPLDLLLRVMTVSIETVNIVNSLPELDIE